MERVTLRHAGVDRQYRLSAPPPAADGPRPLVVVLHGAGGSGEWADGETGWSAFAAGERFAVALPDGLPPDPSRWPKFLTNPRRWNDGGPGPTGEPSTADDVGFLRAVLADAEARTPIDPGRVYVTGFSNGAGMAFRAAAELSDRVAAVAPVAGYCWVADPRPARPVPTLYVIGALDPLVPPAGGAVRSPWRPRPVARPPVADTLDRWATANGCLPPLVEADANGVRVDVYPSRVGAADVRAVTVADLGHHWPGGKGQLAAEIGGPPSDRYDATAEVWAFFRRHAV